MSLRQNMDYNDCDRALFSYQSECHCAKTVLKLFSNFFSLVTSQNVTAPKRPGRDNSRPVRLVTSQNVTAPKLETVIDYALSCLVTSQNVTAPKRSIRAPTVTLSLVTSQNVTAPKLELESDIGDECLVTSQNVTAPKHAACI